MSDVTPRPWPANLVTAPKLQEALRDRLVSALRRCRTALENIPAGALGEGSEAMVDPETGDTAELTWSIRDELIDDINRALSGFESAASQQPPPAGEPAGWEAVEEAVCRVPMPSVELATPYRERVLAALHSHDLAGWRRAGELEQALRDVEEACADSSEDTFTHRGGHGTLAVCPLCGASGAPCDEGCPRPRARELLAAPAPPSPWKALEGLVGELEEIAEGEYATGFSSVSLGPLERLARGKFDAYSDAARRLRRALGLPEREVGHG